jgi:hypothetical protein
MRPAGSVGSRSTSSPSGASVVMRQTRRAIRVFFSSTGCHTLGESWILRALTPEHKALGVPTLPACSS